ncbi:MAG: MFS transporter [Candidatus Lokiarchaeota archaeon]|nr:MFS transporter [Candidatus Lokiarchaeota archaeon]
MLFLSISALTVIVYMQLNSTLSVFLLEVHGFSEFNFGLLLSTNALIVVIFQLWITRKMSKYPPMKVITVGTLLYMVGFGMYAFISEVYLFFIAMIVITIGEMMEMPLAQSVAGIFAPEDKRARYMAVFGFHWAIPNLFGVLLAGIIGDTFGGQWIWILAGVLSLIAAIGFWFLNGITKDRFLELKMNIIEEPKLDPTS